MNKKISEISQRAKFIFKLLVENYLTTGQPMGSKSISSKLNYELSPATIRNVLNEINLYGLIQRDHFSAGSLPSDFGLQFYTQALLEPGQIDKNEKHIIDSSNFTNFPQEYEKITSILNGLSNQASLVINNEKIPKISQISFHKIDKKRVIFIVENEDGTTTNRLVETPQNIEFRDLNTISEFLNKFTNNQTPTQIERNIKLFLQNAQNEINKTTKILIISQKSFLCGDCQV
jgi:heat-inducible transcriptional repressor